MTSKVVGDNEIKVRRRVISGFWRADERNGSHNKTTNIITAVLWCNRTDSGLQLIDADSTKAVFTSTNVFHEKRRRLFDLIAIIELFNLYLKPVKSITWIITTAKLHVSIILLHLYILVCSPNRLWDQNIIYISYGILKF